MFERAKLFPIYVPEYLFVSYYFGFILLNPILKTNKSISTIVLLFYLIFHLFLLALFIIKQNRNIINRATIIIILLLILFTTDAIFRNNNYSFRYLYQFIYCAVVPTLFIGQVRNYKIMLYYYSMFSIIAFIAFGADPLSNYQYFGDYMGFGFNFALPVFLGLFLGVHYFRIRWLWIFEVLCFIDIFIFANRSVLLSILIFSLLYWAFITSKNYRNSWKWLIVSPLFVSIVFYYIKDIVGQLYLYTNSLGYKSYALTHFKRYLQKTDIISMFSGRLNLWDQANEMFNESPIIGHGMGAYQAKYNIYSHNIYYDILIFYGIIGMFIFILLLMPSFRRMLKTKGPSKVFVLLLFSLWCPKLFFSIYFFEEISFWCFLVWGYSSYTIINRVKLKQMLALEI